MTYEITIRDKKFKISDNILEYKKSTITNAIKYNDKLIFDRDPVIFENVISKLIKNDYISELDMNCFVEKICGNNFEKRICFMNDIIDELKYFGLYFDFISVFHKNSIITVNNYISLCYQIQNNINDITYELDNFNFEEDDIGIKTFYYYNNLSYDNKHMAKELFEIIKNKYDCYKYKINIEFLEFDNYYKFYFYERLEEEIKNINREDRDILTRFSKYVYNEGFDPIDDTSIELYGDDIINLAEIVDLIKKYNIKNQFALFNEAVYHKTDNNSSFIGITIYSNKYND